MPKFGIKFLLLAVTVFALLMASLSAGSEVGEDVRRSISLVILFGSAFAAINFRGKRQMFWIAFFAVFLLMGSLTLRNLIPSYAPQFRWVGQMTHDWAANIVEGDNPRSALNSFMSWWIRTTWALLLAAIVGFVAAYIYDRARKERPVV